MRAPELMDEGRCGDDRSHSSHVWMAPHMHITECPGVSDDPNQLIAPVPVKQPAIHQLAEAHGKPSAWLGVVSDVTVASKGKSNRTDLNVKLSANDLSPRAAPGKK